MVLPIKGVRVGSNTLIRVLGLVVILPGLSQILIAHGASSSDDRRRNGMSKFYFDIISLNPNRVGANALRSGWRERLTGLDVESGAVPGAKYFVSVHLAV
jgi:hypothetical protein